MTKRPLILVTNDDSIHAPGIKALTAFMRKIGDVVVVAPDKPHSGTGHSVTILTPLSYKSLRKEPGYEEYSCTGTPADSVKMGLKVILNGRKPDLLVSGINHGSNASVNIVYSGTVAATIEGAILNIPSIGFSLLDYASDARFDHAEKYIQDIALKVLENGLPEGICLNVNIPKMNHREIAGIQVCKQATGYWNEDYDARTDPHGRPYFWITGSFVNTDNRPDTDFHVLDNNYISVVPVKFDFTAHEAINPIKQWFNGGKSNS